MNETNCETALMAKIAELDGEKTEISVETANAHLLICENCRTEFEQMKTLGSLFKKQARREQDANLWAAIEERIGEQTASPVNWKLFVLLGAILVGYKLFEMLPAQSPGLIFKIVPLIFVVALFVFLKENPFRISAELGLER